MYFIGIAIFLLGIFGSMSLKGFSLTLLVVPSAIVINFVPIIAVLTITRSFQAFGNGLKATMFSKKSISEDMRGKAASLFRFLSRITVIMSIFGFLFGVVTILSNLNDFDKMGHALKAALVTPIWGLTLVAVVFEPVVFILKKRDTKIPPK